MVFTGSYLVRYAHKSTQNVSIVTFFFPDASNITYYVASKSTSQTAIGSSVSAAWLQASRTWDWASPKPQCQKDNEGRGQWIEGLFLCGQNIVLNGLFVSICFINVFSPARGSCTKWEAFSTSYRKSRPVRKGLSIVHRNVIPYIHKFCGTSPERYGIYKRRYLTP